MHLAEDRGQ